MYVDRMTVPGRGILHNFLSRDGARFCVLVDTARNRHLFAYDGSDLDVPAREIVLEPDEADQLAEILHSRPLADRLRTLERRVDELIGERGR